ncbi:MAG TPA: hypothetical protein VMJ10_29620 [Kofleriaceae bacterium]|nr:hypothetical protein [Kofleriaceae bacterium]
MTRAGLLALAALAGTARADIWKEASDPDRQRAKYEQALTDGDDYAAQAAASQIGRGNMRQLVDEAAKQYRRAAELEPTEGEPLFRLGTMLYSYYLACYDHTRAGSPLCNSQQPMDRARAEQVLAIWNEFEQRAPLDPRNSVFAEDSLSLLSTRAILETKLATRPHIEEAARLYEKVLARGEVAYANEQTIGNLAETYMMLDRLDDAIAMYRRAGDQEISTAYGLAIALDRDERGAEALEVIYAQGSPAPFFKKLDEHEVFYVPDGEVYYYIALVDEAWDDVDRAIVNWKAYIESGAHPEFQPRARQHLDALIAKQKQHPQHHRRWIDELPF